MNETSPSQLPSWFGFVVGLFGGIALSAGLIGLVLGYSLAGGSVGTAQVADNNPTPPAAPDVPAPPSKPVPPVTDKDHVLGNPDARVTIVEYSDFECPFCKRHAPTLKAILDKYGDDVNIVYRHFPLSFHPNANKLAEASECVAELAGNDAFWKFHDAIFELTTLSSDPAVLGPMAKASGANEAKFKECLASGKHTATVKAQMDAGMAAGVQGTPGNFIVDNETKESRDVSGAQPQSAFDTVIDSILGS